MATKTRIILATSVMLSGIFQTAMAEDQNAKSGSGEIKEIFSLPDATHESNILIVPLSPGPNRKILAPKSTGILLPVLSIIAGTQIRTLDPWERPMMITLTLSSDNRIPTPMSARITDSAYIPYGSVLSGMAYPIQPGQHGNSQQETLIRWHWIRTSKDQILMLVPLKKKTPFVDPHLRQQR